MLSTSASASANDARLSAAEYAHAKRAFQVHTAVFAGSMVLIFFVNLFVNLAAGIAGEWSAWWSGWALIGWTIGLSVHGLVVRLNRPSAIESA